ncbi:MAG: hypothetical protein PHQ43_06165 [Dehalococcoidales bacterium]|jgi:hypothetical protein|nr:hypothetical protein [Dehalococcoidales bacterium]
MAFSLIGWYEALDSAGLSDIAALVDQHVTTDGDDILVPSWAPNLIGVFAYGVSLTGAQISSPSLRKSLLLDVAPINIGAEPVFPLPMVNRLDNPLALTPGEGLRAKCSEGGAGATVVGTLAFLQGEYEEPPGGEVFTVKATSATTLVAYQWHLCPLTLSQQLEAGRYAIVGMRAEAAGAIAARLVIPGSEFRPGVIACDAGGDDGAGLFREGRFGLFGEFEHTFIPQVEFLSASADTAETVFLDVVKV